MLVRVLDAIDRSGLWLARVAALFMAAIAILMLSEIGWRFAFRRSLGITWELATYSMAAVVALAAAETLRSGGHVRVGILLETLPPRLARGIDVLATLLGLGIVAFILSAVGDFVLNNYHRGTRSFEPSRTPLWIPQSLVVIGLTMLLIQLVSRLLRLVVPGAAAPPPRAEGTQP